MEQTLKSNIDIAQVMAGKIQAFATLSQGAMQGFVSNVNYEKMFTELMEQLDKLYKLNDEKLNKLYSEPGNEPETYIEPEVLEEQ